MFILQPYKPSKSYAEQSNGGNSSAWSRITGCGPVDPSSNLGSRPICQEQLSHLLFSNTFLVNCASIDVLNQTFLRGDLT